MREEIGWVEWSNIVVNSNCGQNLRQNLEQMKKYIYYNPELKVDMTQFDEVANLSSETE